MINLHEVLGVDPNPDAARMNPTEKLRGVYKIAALLRRPGVMDLVKHLAAIRKADAA